MVVLPWWFPATALTRDSTACPEDRGLLLLRAQVESVHELGHTIGLIHCPEYTCAMHASRAAEEIDLKGPGFCGECDKAVRAAGLGTRL
ncbi:MAG: hypothetical protein HY706_06235 [Candidatus Hydrogenedentes bacterium]|nr:hypothetical protein [Candidatus Hydrogenedentota bacterium]